MEKELSSLLPSNYTVALHELLALSQNFASLKLREFRNAKATGSRPVWGIFYLYRPFSSVWLERRAYKHFFLDVGFL